MVSQTLKTAISLSELLEEARVVVDQPGEERDQIDRQIRLLLRLYADPRKLAAAQINPDTSDLTDIITALGENPDILELVQEAVGPVVPNTDALEIEYAKKEAQKEARRAEIAQADKEKHLAQQKAAQKRARKVITPAEDISDWREKTVKQFPALAESVTLPTTEELLETIRNSFIAKLAKEKIPVKEKVGIVFAEWGEIVETTKLEPEIKAWLNAAPPASLFELAGIAPEELGAEAAAHTVVIEIEKSLGRTKALPLPPKFEEYLRRNIGHRLADIAEQDLSLPETAEAIRRIIPGAVIKTTEELLELGTALSPSTVAVIERILPKAVKEQTDGLMAGVIIVKSKPTIQPASPLPEFPEIIELEAIEMAAKEIGRTFPVDEKLSVEMAKLETAPPEGRAEVAATVMPAIANKFPVGIKVEKLAPAELQQLRNDVKTVVLAAVAEMAPDLIKITGPLSPAQTKVMVAALTPETEEELKKFFSQLPLPTPPKIEGSSPKRPLGLEVATSLPSLREQQRLVLAIFAVKNPDGRTLAETLEHEMLTIGMTPENSLFLQQQVLDRYAALLTSQGITVEAIDQTVNSLEENRVANQAQISFLKKIRPVMVSLQKNIPERDLNLLAHKRVRERQGGAPAFALRASNLTIYFRERAQFNSRFNLLGYRRITFPPNYTFVINRLTFWRTRIFSGVSSHFWSSSFGRGVEGGLRRLTTTGMQSIWNLAKFGGQEGLKKLVSGATSKVAGKILAQAIGSLAPGIGNVVAALGPGLLKKATNLLTLGLPNLINRLLGGKGFNEASLLKTAVKIVILTILGVTVGPIILGMVTMSGQFGSAFVSSGRGAVFFPGGVPQGIAPNCTDNGRHFAEEVICKLTTGSFPCNQKRMNQSTKATVDTCFGQINLARGDKNSVKGEFDSSVANNTSLQCVGFVAGIQKGIGQTITKSGDACAYAHGDPPGGYVYVNRQDAVKGDLVVWDGSNCGTNNGYHYGHIAVIIERPTNPSNNPPEMNEIVIAEAIGDDAGEKGDLLIRQVPLSDPAIGNFLRWNK